MKLTKFLTHTEFVDSALLKYPKARRIAVSNFTMGYSELSMEANMNLEMDAGMYKWNAQTVNAIRHVLKLKALQSMSDKKASVLA